MRRDLTFKTASIAGASDLTILAPIKKGLVPALDAITYKTRVKRVLRLLHVGRTISHEYEIGRVLSDAVERVGKIHSIRIAILEPEDKVLLVVTFDGAWESYIRVIWQKVSRLLDLIFCNTEGYKLGWESSYDDWCTWLRSAQAETMFLYSQPNLTNTDTHYLQSIERIQRRETELEVADSHIAKFNVPSAEKNAELLWSRGVDLNNKPYGQGKPSIFKGPAFRQGVKTLASLYRLSDVYVPTVGDGAILHRAAQEMLIEFKLMVKNYLFGGALAIARKHHADALDWFDISQDYERTVPPLAPTQAVPTGSSEVQGGILEPYSGISDGCLLLIAFESAAGMAVFLNKFKPTTIKDQETLHSRGIAQNIAITVEGLRLAGWNDAEVSELPEEFVQGMDKRQGILGDLYANHPRRWRHPTMNWAMGENAADESSNSSLPRVQLSSVHAVIQLHFSAGIANNSPKQTLLTRLENILGVNSTGDFTHGAIPMSLQWMHRMKDGGKAIEHFGFGEAESNPVYQHQSSSSFNNQVHIGEVIHGYPNSADRDVPANGAKSDRAKKVLNNGSFLVIRKLRQDIKVLNDLVDNAVKNQPIGVSPLSRDTVLANMMGRWPEGAAPLAGRPLVNGGVMAGSNDFNFKSDPSGTTCPLQAHIRRANPRANSEDAGAIGKRPPRIVRRGMSYGDQHVVTANAKATEDSLSKERGLIFMAYNASIGEQFEVIQRWIAGGNSTGAYSGQSDPFLGVAEPGRPRFFQFQHEGRAQRIALDGSDEIHEAAKPIVQLEWGMYLFAPSVTALEELAVRASQPSSEVIEWSPERGEDLIKDLKALSAAAGEDAAKLAWKEVLEDPDSATDFKAASIWAAIRSNHGGVLETPFGVLVASQALADEVLLDSPGNLTAEEYLPRMGDSFGKLYLGMDPGRKDHAYENESAAANAAVLMIGKNFDETCLAAEQAVHKTIEEFVLNAMNSVKREGEPRWQATIDIRNLIEKVITQFCEKWFGLSTLGGHFKQGAMKWQSPMNAGVPRYPGHFMAPSRYVFQPHPSDTVRKVAEVHGKSLNTAMSNYLTAYGGVLKNTHPLVKSILEKGDDLKDPGYAPRTLLGLMMGFVPTTDGMMRRIGHEWLRDGSLWSLRTRHSANTGDFTATFTRAFYNAFLLRAAPELLWRTAKTEHQIGSGAHAVTVKAQDKVIVCQISAAHEGLEQGKTDAYIYAFGDIRKAGALSPKPAHACPGKDAAMAVMWGFLKGLVTCPYPMQPGPGALSFVVEGDSTATTIFRRRTRVVESGMKTTQTETTAGSGKKSIELFAFGDSWLWQYDATEDSFFNIVSSLKKQGFSFLASPPELPDPIDAPSDSILDTGFNFPGRKVSELPGKMEELRERFVKLTEKKFVVNAILVSAGGNDLADHDPGIGYSSAKLFGLLVENATSVNAALNTAAKKKFFDELELHYTATLTQLVNLTVVPIFIHGYDFPIPDGRAFQVDNVDEMGPWLQPVFRMKNIGSKVALEVMSALINELNGVIKGVVGNVAILKGRVHFVELAGILSSQSDYGNPLVDRKYEKYWANELHPTDIGFDILAQEVIKKLTEVAVVKADAGIAAIPAINIVQ